MTPTFSSSWVLILVTEEKTGRRTELSRNEVIVLAVLSLRC